MSGPSWILPSPTSGVSGLPAADVAAGDAAFFGEDIWFDIAAPDVTLGQADYVTTASGDLAVATGREALRQSLLRRFITRPGEMPTLPDYGAGAVDFVKAKNTAATRAELIGILTVQCLRDPRVLSVDTVAVDRLDDGSDGVKISLNVTPRGRLRSDRSLPIHLEIR